MFAHEEHYSVLSRLGRPSTFLTLKNPDIHLTCSAFFSLISAQSNGKNSPSVILPQRTSKGLSWSGFHQAAFFTCVAMREETPRDVLFVFFGNRIFQTPTNQTRLVLQGSYQYWDGDTHSGCGLPSLGTGIFYDVDISSELLDFFYCAAVMNGLYSCKFSPLTKAQGHT